ncbi:hypothetical protein JNM05_12200 [bacterium]|nr:hypothetical protein [bacterium]
MNRYCYESYEDAVMKNYLVFITLFSLTSLTHIYSQDSTVSVVIQPKKDQNVMPIQQMNRPKSPSNAFLLSVGSTMIPILIGINKEDLVLVAAGSLIGPSIGNFYAGGTKRGINGILLRGAGAIMSVAGILVYFSSGNETLNDEGDYDYGHDGETLFYAGLAVIGISAVWDIVKAPTSAREYNKKHGLSFSPLYDPLRKTGGVSFAYRF